MNKKLFAAVIAVAALLCTAGVAGAGYPLTGGGEIFSQALTAPQEPVITGPTALGVFRAAPEDDYLYLWLNGVKLFDRPSMVWKNQQFVLEWLTAQPARQKIWNWTLLGKVSEVVVGHSVYQSAQRAPSLYLMALSTLAKAVVLVRRQIELKAPSLALPKDDIDVAEAIEAFLKANGPARAASRLEAVVYLPHPDKLWQTGAKGIIGLGPLEAEVELPAGEAARKKALVELAENQERRLSNMTKALLDRIIAPRAEEGR